MTWLTDDRGNRCAVEYFGSREAAQEALDSLQNCDDCTNCSECSGCSRCLGCSWCSWCSGCSRCSKCSECSECSGCSCVEGVKKSEAGSIVPPVPVVADLHKKIYESASQPGALEMKDWHKCKKTHCRAGWTVTVAGEEGRRLEEFFNTELAAMLIYRATGYEIDPARFYDDNEAALADMKRLAEGEAQ